MASAVVVVVAAAALLLLLAAPRAAAVAMVKEGHDSTVRPRLQTWEFDPDSGRKYLDVWEAEGKPNFSRLFLSRIRVAKVLSVLLIPPLVIFSYDDVGKETAITPIQRGFSSWWSAFTALDEADVRKARALGPSPARLRAAAEAEGEAREARAAAAANAVAPQPSR